MLVHSAHTHIQFLAPNFVRVTAFQIVRSPAPINLTARKGNLYLKID